MDSLWTTSLMPMRDTVEEEKVRGYLCLVCQILGASFLCFPRFTSKTPNLQCTTQKRTSIAELGAPAAQRRCSRHDPPHPRPPLASHVHTRSLSVAAAGHHPTSDPSRNTHSRLVTLTCVYSGITVLNCS